MDRRSAMDEYRVDHPSNIKDLMLEYRVDRQLLEAQATGAGFVAIVNQFNFNRD